jgi:hypothetical protein
MAFHTTTLSDTAILVCSDCDHSTKTTNIDSVKRSAVRHEAKTGHYVTVYYQRAFMPTRLFSFADRENSA